MGRLETIYNTMMKLEEEKDIGLGQYWGFADLWNSLPDSFKIKEDPRPLDEKEKDWKFKDRVIKVKKEMGIDITPPDVIDICQYDTFPPQQQLIGSCGGEAGANMMENIINELSDKKQQQGIALSGQFLYWCAEQLDGHPEEGTFGWAVCNALRKYGVCKNEFYSEVDNFIEIYKPSDYALEEALKRRINSYYVIKTVEEMALALKWGYRIWMSFRCHSGWGGPIVREPNFNEFWLGGHAIEGTGVWLSKGLIGAYNSWGIGGDGSGHMKITIDYFKKYLIEVRAIKYDNFL